MQGEQASPGIRLMSKSLQILYIRYELGSRKKWSTCSLNHSAT